MIITHTTYLVDLLLSLLHLVIPVLAPAHGSMGWCTVEAYQRVSRSTIIPKYKTSVWVLTGCITSIVRGREKQLTKGERLVRLSIVAR